ncbi:putative mitochondrial carrier [Phaeomoniella chlamydospora]|uniref:Mitochondrial glycine transporter n=1 Tax=Phaeomoniella chlamydospora TaxID=158046 RepID=A0A0G2EZP2_PHACM|nr:putative mitochondrial carrier [Phaeomoniella chlamydospora]
MSEASQNVSKAKAHPLFHFGSGALSGVTTAILLQPADLLKTRVQQSRTASLRTTLKTILSSPHPITSLWRGTLPSALRTSLGSAVYFTTLSTLRQNVAARKQALNTTSLSVANGVLPFSSSVLPRLSPTENLATGAIARVLAGFILMPMTVLKVRFESDLYSYNSLYGASKDIYRQHGLRGFFSGFGATAIRDAPYAGLYVVFYESTKSRLSQFFLHNTSTDSTDSSNTAASSPSSPASNTPSRTAAAINFTSAALASGFATTISNPFDAIKTRLQLLPSKYGNMFRTLKIMLREDGARSLFGGLGLRMARKAASSALAWTVYEELIGRAERRVEKGTKDRRGGNKDGAGNPI